MRQVLVVTFIPWAVLCALASPTLGNEAPAGPPVCAAAAALVEDGHPQRAIEVLDAMASSSPRCPGLRKSAKEARRDAVTLFRYAETLAGRAANDATLWPDVQGLADEIAELDSDVEVGTRTLTDLEQDVDEGLAENRDFLSQDGVEASSDGWSGLADGYLKDLLRILAAAAGTAILLLALARLAVTFPWFNEWWRSSRLSRGIAQWVGVSALIATSLGVALTLPDAVGNSSVDWWPAIALGLTGAVVAVAALTYVLSTRLRVSISVTGETEKAGTTEIVALLRELGASAPQGLEVPRGADLTALEGKNILTSSTSWLAPVLNVVQQILGFTPWRVVVDHKTDPDGKVAVETFVVVTRNGRSVDAATIRRQPFGPTGPTVDTAKMAAAFVLKALSDGYDASDFRGLAGAQEWASIGLQYVATTDGSLSQEHRKELLTKAVDLDPSNLLAQVSLKHQQYRHVKSHDELHTYEAWLRGLVGRGGVEGSNVIAAYRDLDLRVHYTALAVAFNHRAALGENCSGWAGHADRSISNWARDLDRMLAEPQKSAAERILCKVPVVRLHVQRNRDERLPSVRLRNRMRIAAGPMLVQAGVWNRRDLRRLRMDSPTSEYNTICWQTAVGPITDAHVTRLNRVLASQDDIEWAKEDPTLQPLRSLSEWRKNFGARPRSFLEVAPFQPHADGLSRLGLNSITTLTRSSLPAYEAARALGISHSAYSRLADAAALLATIEHEDLRVARVEIFAALWELGIGSLTALKSSAYTDKQIVDKVGKALDDLPVPQPDPKALRAWVRVHRPRPSQPRGPASSVDTGTTTTIPWP